MLGEAFFGRPVLFLGAEREGAPRDVYRAFVRLDVAGKPIAVQRVRNVTETPIGDDVALELRRGKAVFATVAFGRIQGVTILDTSGVPESHKRGTWLDGLKLAVNSYQESGSFAGLGRTDVVLDLPAERARLALDPPLLTIDPGSKERELVYHLETGKLTSGDGGEPYAARAVPQVHRPKPSLLWAVDTVRHETGPEPIAWLENQVFGARDKLKRTTYGLLSDSAESELADDVADDVPTAVVLDTSKLGDSDTGWPPPAVPSIWKETKPGEGEWKPVDVPWLTAPPEAPREKGAPPPPKRDAYFYRTFIRPDRKRPYSEVVLVAMDMRQLELGMEAGFEDPKPLTGPPGSGRLPREKEVLDRVVATFNGAFKTTHGKYGMMVRKRVLLPPVPNAASVVITDQREVRLGNWPDNDRIPQEVISYRQNLDPLVEDGVANPSGRYIWGWQLAGTSVMTQRTALCVTAAGHLYFAFGKEIDGPTLGTALKQAGCSYGIHLDMNPKHCGFVFTDIVDQRKKEYKLQLLDEEMAIPPDKFVRWSPKDFFYVMVRNPRPEDGTNIRWLVDSGTQPPPSFIPGIFTATYKLGSLDVELTAFEPQRLEWRVRAGAREPEGGAGAQPRKLELTGEDTHRVLTSINLGHAIPAAPSGIAFDGKPALEPDAESATLVVAPRSTPRIYPPGEAPKLAESEDAVQLPLLADKGSLLPRAREHGSMHMRGALCITARGRVLVARGRHDSSDPLASALLRAGCERVVGLDRGSRHPSFVHRAGTPTPPLSGYDTTVLYGLGRPMRPFASRWHAAGAKPSDKPTGMDYPIGRVKK